MDAKHVKQLKKALEEESKAIEKQLKQIARKNPNVEDDWQANFKKMDSSNTLDEQAQNVTTWERQRAIEQELETRLKEVKNALKNIETKDYGKCQTCKAEINMKRLKAIPASTKCINCVKNRPQLT
ncbi:MAG: TraR/DksA C4-type zinc finger protein [Parcubacteria group bacterium]